MTKQVTDKMINTFTQAMLLSMPEVEDHYDQVKLGLEAVFKSLSNTCISDGGYCGVGGFCNQTEVDTLKAQVNCLREIVSKVNKPIFIFEQSVREEITRSLEATPEQCLAEVNARVIEQLKTRFSFWIKTSPNTHIYVEDNKSDGVFDSFQQFLAWYAKELREQAK